MIKNYAKIYDIRNIYSMEDELTDDAKIYVYNAKTDKPILKRS